MSELNYIRPTSIDTDKLGPGKKLVVSVDPKCLPVSELNMTFSLEIVSVDSEMVVARDPRGRTFEWPLNSLRRGSHDFYIFRGVTSQPSRPNTNTEYDKLMARMRRA